MQTHSTISIHHVNFMINLCIFENLMDIRLILMDKEWSLFEKSSKYSRDIQILFDFHGRYIGSWMIICQCFFPSYISHTSSIMSMIYKSIQGRIFRQKIQKNWYFWCIRNNFWFSMVNFYSLLINYSENGADLFNIKIGKQNFLNSSDLQWRIFHLVNIFDIIDAEKFDW